jgi:molybdopterin-dependent oxidoreductase alpha subunit
MAGTMLRERSFFKTARALVRQNKPEGFACVSCAWTKPAKPLPFEICESGGKATAWELTGREASLGFFEKNTVSELEHWEDHQLEKLGRLTYPLKYDAASDRYRPVSYLDAFNEIGAALQNYDPRSVVFYLCGHASLETAYMYQLFGRIYGCNNFPNSSNMCHESTSYALPKAIGIPVGTVILEDFEKAECILSFGQNAGTTSPRILSPLQDASKRKIPIVTFNPIRERGWESFRHPQSSQLLTGAYTKISSHFYQVRVGGDAAAILGICKALLEAEDRAKAAGQAPVLDHDFIQNHTAGFEEFASVVRQLPWAQIEERSGISKNDLEIVADVYAHSNKTIVCYGMGLTQHPAGVENVRLLCNLMFLRGNIGKPGAGICPVRGHSNIQGQRTVGHGHNTANVPLDTYKRLHAFTPPDYIGLDTVGSCEAIINGRINAFLGLGGNFLRATPDNHVMEEAWRNIPLTVQVSTKLNRSHVIHGRQAYILPCLGRIEQDAQASGLQAVSIEDATGCMHGSIGKAAPASPDLLSEPKIVAELAKATVPGKSNIDWDRWVSYYGHIREDIARTHPEIFHDFNKHMWAPGGHHRPLPARVRDWRTETKRANFHTPKDFFEYHEKLNAPDEFDLITLRSNDQFNTTIYGFKDRYREIHGTRRVVLMNPNDIDRLGFQEGEAADVFGDDSDGRIRRVGGLRIVAYNIPERCCAGYYPECNALIPWWHHAKESNTPAAKLVKVRVRRAGAPDKKESA